MRVKFSYFLLLLAAVVVLVNVSCKKTKLLTTGGELQFSTDTLLFDTVFTTQASFTNSFKIYNPQNEKIRISSVRMANLNGYGKYFHLNVDGYPGDKVPEIEIAPHDSAFVFATVKIDPTNADNPFVIEDKIIATLNGKDYELPVMAYGQNAYYIAGKTGDSVETLPTQTFLTDKPYVLMHNVGVEPGATLTIPAGCRMYMHADARLFVYGTLKVNGTKTDSVIFQGDRLDRNYFGYEGYPGEWGGIAFMPQSQNNELRYTIVTNCGNSAGNFYPAGIFVSKDFSTGQQASVFLDHVTVSNSIGYGIMSIGGKITAENCLAHTCGAEALALVRGGDYNFKNCSFIVYGNDKVSHIQEPTAALFNYLQIDDTHYIGGDMNATLTNCVIWGSLENELVCDKKNEFAYNVTLNNCFIKDGTDAINAAVVQNACIFNADPKFADYNKFDFHATTGSDMIDKGTSTNFIGIGTDLDDKPRQHNTIDIGCYEFQD